MLHHFPTFPSVLALGQKSGPHFHFARTGGFSFSAMASAFQQQSSRGFKGIWIPAEVWIRDDISTTEKCLLAEIESLDDGEGCFASNEYLGTFLKVSTGRLKNILVELSKRGLVESFAFDGRRRKLKQTAYRVTAEVTKTLPQSSAVTKTLPQQSRNSDGSSNIEDRKEDNKAKKHDLPLIPLLLNTPEFAEAWADWITYRKERRSQLTSIGAKNIFLKIERERWSPEKAAASLRDSMANGWLGLFEPKTNGHSAPSLPGGNAPKVPLMR